MKHPWFNLRMLIVGVLLVAFYVPVVGVAIWLGAPIYAAIPIILGGLTIQYLVGARRALKSVDAQPFPDEGEQAEFIREKLDTHAKALGVKTPKLSVGHMGSPNAFAIGRRGSGHIVLSMSLLQILSPEEVEAVLVHELSHLRSRDTVPVIIGEGSAGIAFIIGSAIASLILPKKAKRGVRSAETRFGRAAHTLVMFLVFAISRQREYVADADAKNVLGTGSPLQTALEKIDYIHHTERVSPPPEAVETLCISSDWSMAMLGATHPPIEDRIKQLAD